LIDEEMRRRIGPLESRVVDAEIHSLRFQYRMLVQEVSRKRANVAEVAWMVRAPGPWCGIEFRMRIEELAPDRPRVLFPRTVAILHRRAPPWMRDRTCLALQGHFCLCRECPEFGRDLFRLWYSRGDGPDTLWDALVTAYFEAFEGERERVGDLPLPIRVVANETPHPSRQGE
jgi:hypothetical protein